MLESDVACATEALVETLAKAMYEEYHADWIAVGGVTWETLVECVPKEAEQMRRYARTALRILPMESAFALSAHLLAVNAHHTKLGVHLQDQTPGDVLAHMKREVDELTDDQDDIEELADIVNLCASFAARKGWTPMELARAMRRKMLARFTIPGCVTDDGHVSQAQEMPQ